ncbi:phosphatidylinositol transfer protein alpha isoform-like [Tigriopus californicus]|uniref:phosphatidylinositol transfer protein alpha isoform-like n=1 Tax=Tigriopus californicus TaxID=6832 RepID=UPI0027DAB07C|nr:phosphatidylinositol transfer protein alpha isoform-like [Tigriopus californicus]XP_059098479.1 phosphatidylinositol transfer protein alpha isoform-like [Tigriopus californicus]
MLITEFRVTLPMTVEEYQVGQLYSVAEASMNETGGGEGVEVEKNEPYDNYPLLNGKFLKGQYTRKIYHLASKVPTLVKWIAPKGALEILEEAWNAYPYCKTVLTNPGYMKKNFFIKVETYHLADRGESENVHQLTKEQLAQRKVVHIDIANDPVLASDYKKKEDPTQFTSKGGRGPLGGDWRKTVQPVMTAYKLVTIEFKWLGLQNKVEKYGMEAERRLFTNFHRQLFCSIDDWIELTMEDIRKLEDQTQADLKQQRLTGEVRGTKPV